METAAKGYDKVASRGGAGKVLKMTIPHWLTGLTALMVLAAFVVFAFRQGMKVRPSGNNHQEGVSNYLDSHRSNDTGPP
jgi:hypothetical protein